MCETVAPDLDEPSPNVQDHHVAFDDPEPLNEQSNLLQLEVKLAIDEGGGGGAVEYMSL